jgi:ATP-dependent exoDNAse (exonuclease V) beta subunit
VSAAPTLPPIDQTDREAVRDGHDHGVFVEAGAGTGKTTALVSRVVSMVATGWLELRELAAITFTEAAASELRDRIRDGLERAADGRDEQVTQPAERARCAAALHQLDDAALTTLHGFAQRILAEHPLEIGLPPGFEVLDDIRARLAFDQRWHAFVDELYADVELEETLLRGLALGVGPDALRDIARHLDDHHDRLTGQHPAVPPLPPVDLVTVRERFARLVELRGGCAFTEDLLAQHIDGLLPWGDRVRAVDGTDVLAELEVLLGAPKLASGRKGKAGSWPDIDSAREAAAALAVAVEGALLEQRLAVIAALVDRVQTFVRGSADDRRRAGTLEFHDLLVLARDLLRADTSVRAAVASRYRCLLLDEFQDTDPLQIELAVLLTTDDPDAGDADWSELTPRSGALVVVGDPKQSIYRFRRADLRVYHRAQRELGLDRRSLVENFRSVPGILDFVNEVFEGLLHEEIGVQAEHVELHAHRSAIGADDAVAVFGAPRRSSVGEIRAEEADDVAAIVRAVKRERWQVADPSTGMVRDATYDDIALLIPSRTVLPAIEDSLERADIPVRVESQSLVFSTAEVRDLLAALSAIDDPTDEVGVVASLRSAAFACSDAQLVEFVRAGGRWDYRSTPDVVLEALGADHPVVVGLAALRGFWEQRWWRTVGETVAAIVHERRLLELASARRRPRDHWRRIRYLLDQARAWDDAGGASLRSFVEWIQQQADERARVMESVAPEPDDDAVRILTVHGAKGLEFPIVILAGLNTQPVRATRGVVWGPTGPEFGIGVKSRGTRSQTPGFADANAEEDRHDEAERLRLLYVAMTRARDHLVVSIHHKEGADCHAARVVERLGAAHYSTLEPAEPPRRAKPRPGAAPAAADAAARAAWIDRRDRTLAHAARPASVAATGLTKLAATDDDGPGDETVERPAWQRGRAGTAIGRAVHAVLQTIDLATGAGLEATARAQALAEEVPDREAEIRALARSVLDAPIVRAAVSAPHRFWREVPVGASVSGAVLEGFVDLLVETPDGLVVVDYKTDRAPGDADVDAALARYTPQGAAYALAIEQVLDRPVRRCVFVFARDGGPAVEREIADLPAAVTAARETLGTMASIP